MNKWTNVVTDPLGLAGFALFLVFSFVALRRQSQKPRWIVMSFITLAFLAILGGIGLSYLRQSGQRPVVIPASAPPGSKQIEQQTSGSHSPAVADVHGNVTIIQGSSSSEKPPQDRR